jgi:actin related protein 2/3 complex subunit 4
MSKELILHPLVISRDSEQRCLIEASVNAVRVSIKIKQSDALDTVIVDKFSRFLAMRADEFEILRRKPVEGYNISFLITNFHLEALKKDEIVDFIIHFMKLIDAEISSMKLNVNARARTVAHLYLSQFG